MTSEGPHKTTLNITSTPTPPQNKDSTKIKDTPPQNVDSTEIKTMPPQNVDSTEIKTTPPQNVNSTEVKATPPQSVDSSEVKATDQAVSSTATTNNSDVSKPGLIEKAKYGQQYGGTKHENTTSEFSKVGRKPDTRDLDAIREMMKDALKGGESAIELLNEKVQELIESKQRDTEMIEELQIKTEELSRLLKEERENNAKLMSSEIQKELLAKNKEIEELRNATTELRDETERLRTSLSKAAGDKLRDGNPNIADLSDQHRPEKLCEKFNNLYDNLWTDAFEKLNKADNSDRVVCSNLVQIFRSCWDFCCEYADRQLGALQHFMIHPEGNQNDRGHQKLTQALTSLELKLVREARKSLASHSLANLTQFYWKCKANHKDHLRPFVNACLEICWYSAIQDPKLDFTFDPTKNKDDFRGYTQGGKYVDYLVWPAMYLHVDGPLLYKGVVQMKEAEREQM